MVFEFEQNILQIKVRNFVPSNQYAVDWWQFTFVELCEDISSTLSTLWDTACMLITSNKEHNSLGLCISTIPWVKNVYYALLVYKIHAIALAIAFDAFVAYFK